MQVHALALALMSRRPTVHDAETPLPVPHAVAYKLFAESAYHWLPLRMTAPRPYRYPRGHVGHARLEREVDGVALVFTVWYSYDPRARLIRWSTDTADLTIAGDARFEPISPKTCRLHYRCSVDLPALDEALALELTHDGGATRVVRDFHDRVIAALRA